MRPTSRSRLCMSWPPSRCATGCPSCYSRGPSRTPSRGRSGSGHAGAFDSVRSGRPYRVASHLPANWCRTTPTRLTTNWPASPRCCFRRPCCFSSGTSYLARRASDATLRWGCLTLGIATLAGVVIACAGVDLWGDSSDLLRWDTRVERVFSVVRVGLFVYCLLLLVRFCHVFWTAAGAAEPRTIAGSRSASARR